MDEATVQLHPDEVAALPRIIKGLKQLDGESWGVAAALERAFQPVAHECDPPCYQCLSPDGPDD